MSAMKPVLALLARRLPSLVLTLLGTSLVTFVISHLVPSDTARLIAGDGASEAVVAGIRAKLGLDQPLWTQYAVYLSQLGRGDLGVSIRTGEPVLAELLRAAPATFELAAVAFTLIVVFSLGLGCLAALNRDRFADQIIRIVSALAISTPTFWTSLLLIGLFGAALGWSPLGGRIDPDLPPIPSLTGFLTIDAILRGRPDVLISALGHLILPAITLAVASSGAAVRLIRASLLEVLGQDYIRRARSGGLSEWVVLTRYALPNALLPFITTLGLTLADLLGGAVVTEMIFSWPGLGSYTLAAIAGLDFPAIMGFTVLAAAVYALANLFVDLLNGFLDPRARSSS
jgi:peptide/nickel transport system permease protein